MSRRTAVWLLACLGALALLLFGLWLAGFAISVKFVPVV